MSSSKSLSHPQPVSTSAFQLINLFFAKVLTG
jgi:hypothetical protein